MFAQKSDGFVRDGSAEERISALFQPDTLITDQFNETYRRQLPLEPEARLVIAVLEDGINAFQDNFVATNVRKRRLFEEAEEWIFGAGNNWIFAFESVCGLLNLNPDYLRRGLREWQSQHGADKSKVEQDVATPRRAA